MVQSFTNRIAVSQWVFATFSFLPFFDLPASNDAFSRASMALSRYPFACEMAGGSSLTNSISGVLITINVLVKLEPRGGSTRLSLTPLSLSSPGFFHLRLVPLSGHREITNFGYRVFAPASLGDHKRGYCASVVHTPDWD